MQEIHGEFFQKLRNVVIRWCMIHHGLDPHPALLAPLQQSQSPLLFLLSRTFVGDIVLGSRFDRVGSRNRVPPNIIIVAGGRVLLLVLLLLLRLGPGLPGHVAVVGAVRDGPRDLGGMLGGLGHSRDVAGVGSTSS